MAQERTLEARLAALERRLDPTTGTDTIGTRPSSERAPQAVDGGAIEDRLDDLESTVADLEGAVQALRGYVGNVEHVNQEVERRANAAIAAVERLESAPKTPPPIATAGTTGDVGDDTESSADTAQVEGSSTSGSDAGLFDRFVRST